MRRAAALSVLSVALVILWPSSAAAQRADLARARTLYNERQFDAAIEAATVAQKQPATADPATVVLGRAHLERYRERANPDDLSAARVALGTVRVSNLDPRDHVDFLMALGEALFFEDDYGAAATLFESGIDRAIAQGVETGESMLEWWGSAVERHADALDRDGRINAFRRLRERMARELARDPGSAAAAYFPGCGGPRLRRAGRGVERRDCRLGPRAARRARDRRRCALISTSWSCRASSPTASPRWPSSGANRRNRIFAASGRW